jgi:hypothetical protein
MVLSALHANTSAPCNNSMLIGMLQLEIEVGTFLTFVMVFLLVYYVCKRKS